MAGLSEWRSTREEELYSPAERRPREYRRKEEAKPVKAEGDKDPDVWQELVSGATAVASAALPWVLALAPLALGPIILLGPSALNGSSSWLTDWLKSAGLIK